MNEINSNAVASLLERLEHPIKYIKADDLYETPVTIPENPQEALAIICRALLDRKVIPG